MAPDAPIKGTRESGLISTWATAATTPAAR
jgi:hypothetical protein